MPYPSVVFKVSPDVLKQIADSAHRNDNTQTQSFHEQIIFSLLAKVGQQDKIQEGVIHTYPDFSFQINSPEIVDALTKQALENLCKKTLDAQDEWILESVLKTPGYEYLYVDDNRYLNAILLNKKLSDQLPLTEQTQARIRLEDGGLRLLDEKICQYIDAQISLNSLRNEAEVILKNLGFELFEGKLFKKGGPPINAEKSKLLSLLLNGDTQFISTAIQIYLPQALNNLKEGKSTAIDQALIKKIIEDEKLRSFYTFNLEQIKNLAAYNENLSHILLSEDKYRELIRNENFNRLGIYGKVKPNGSFYYDVSLSEEKKKEEETTLDDYADRFFLGKTKVKPGDAFFDFKRGDILEGYQVRTKEPSVIHPLITSFNKDVKNDEDRATLIKYMKDMPGQALQSEGASRAILIHQKFDLVGIQGLGKIIAYLRPNKSHPNQRKIFSALYHFVGFGIASNGEAIHYIINSQGWFTEISEERAEEIEKGATKITVEISDKYALKFNARDAHREFLKRMEKEYQVKCLAKEIEEFEFEPIEKKVKEGQEEKIIPSMQHKFSKVESQYSAYLINRKFVKQALADLKDNPQHADARLYINAGLRDPRFFTHNFEDLQAIAKLDAKWAELILHNYRNKGFALSRLQRAQIAQGHPELQLQLLKEGRPGLRGALTRGVFNRAKNLVGGALPKEALWHIFADQFVKTDGSLKLKEGPQSLSIVEEIFKYHINRIGSWWKSMPAEFSLAKAEARQAILLVAQRTDDLGKLVAEKLLKEQTLFNLSNDEINTLLESHQDLKSLQKEAGLKRSSSDLSSSSAGVSTSTSRENSSDYLGDSPPPRHGSAAAVAAQHQDLFQAVSASEKAEPLKIDPFGKQAEQIIKRVSLKIPEIRIVDIVDQKWGEVESVSELDKKLQSLIIKHNQASDALKYSSSDWYTYAMTWLSEIGEPEDISDGEPAPETYYAAWEKFKDEIRKLLEGDQTQEIIKKLRTALVAANKEGKGEIFTYQNLAQFFVSLIYEHARNNEKEYDKKAYEAWVDKFKSILVRIKSIDEGTVEEYSQSTHTHQEMLPINLEGDVKQAKELNIAQGGDLAKKIGEHYEKALTFLQEHTKDSQLKYLHGKNQKTMEKKPEQQEDAILDDKGFHPK